jgi:hypothetical protein
MIRTSVLCALTSLLLAAAGCQESPDQPRRAALDQGKLVSDPEPGFEAAYLADQKQVKLVQRTVPISYEPLDTFRARAGAKARSSASAQASGMPDAGEKKKGLFGRLKNALAEKVGAATTLLPGGAPAAAATPQAETIDPDDSAGGAPDDEDPDDEDDESLDDEDLDDQDDENLDDGDNEQPADEDPDGEDEEQLDDEDDEQPASADDEELDDEDDEEFDGDEEPEDDGQDDQEDGDEDEI